MRSAFRESATLSRMLTAYRRNWKNEALIFAWRIRRSAGTSWVTGFCSFSPPARYSTPSIAAVFRAGAAPCKSDGQEREERTGRGRTSGPSPVSAKRKRSSLGWSTFSVHRRSTQSSAQGYRRAYCSWGRPVPVRPCSAGRLPERPAFPSSRWRVPILWSSSWVSARPECASSLKKPRAVRPVSCSSTRSMRLRDGAARVSAAETMSGNRP